MKHILSLVSTLVLALSAMSQVTIPFDVPLPTWKGVLTAKTEHGPLVFEKANASSRNLITVERGEETDYRWESPSMYIGDTESKFTIEPETHIPYISVAGAWAEVEVHGDNGDFKGWAVASNLVSLKLKDLTTQDLENCNRTVTWSQEDGTYAVVVASECPGWTVFCVGKLKEGYVVCPYSCAIEWGDTEYSGILNGKIGNGGADLSKFTLKDVEYILAHAEKSETFVGYGFLNDEGEKEIGWIWTALVGTPATADNNLVYTNVEVEPSYPGGVAALFTAIAKNTRYPAIALENGIQGKVTVRFIVERDGSITNAKVLKSVDPDLDREALRVVGTLRRMSSPGKINGRAVRTYYIVPVNFTIPK